MVIIITMKTETTLLCCVADCKDDNDMSGLPIFSNASLCESVNTKVALVLLGHGLIRKKCTWSIEALDHIAYYNLPDDMHPNDTFYLSDLHSVLLNIIPLGDVPVHFSLLGMAVYASVTQMCMQSFINKT